MKELKELPKKWCIKLDNQLVVDYCNENGELPPYIISSQGNIYAHFPPFNEFTTCNWILDGYTEINLDQFKKWVLKQNEVREQDWLIQEAKERYPVGTTYLCANKSSKEVVKNDFKCYNLKNDFKCYYFENWVITDGNGGYVYWDNKWAEIVDSPQQKLKNNEMKETQVIYLNEDDRPKVEEPLSYPDWLFTKTKSYDNLDRTETTYYVNKYVEYRNNFKANDKPIEFENDLNIAHEFDIIVVISPTEFFLFKKGETPYRMSGKLNNGKVK